MRAALLVIGLIFIFSQIVSAYTVSPITVNPKGSLLQCEPVNATFVISNPQSGTNDYPGADNIELFTELDSPVWSLTLLTDGDQKVFPKQQSGRVLLSEWNLTGFNRNTAHEQIQINLAGNVPRVPQTSNKTIVRIMQTSKDNNPVAGSVRSAVEVVVNTCCIDIECNYIIPLEDDLQQLRTDIDQNATMGIDTAAAEAKYSDAEQKIKTAKSLPSTQYAQVYNNINAAHAAITDGEQALDRAWAENEVTNAQVPINNADTVIALFKANNSTAENSHLPAIIAKRDVAMSYIVSAHEEISNGNYSQARAKADEAYRLGNESYDDILSLQRCVPDCHPDPIYQSIIRAGIVVIILTIIGIIWWKKFPKK
jgi:hypothetical protein